MKIVWRVLLLRQFFCAVFNLSAQDLPLNPQIIYNLEESRTQEAFLRLQLLELNNKEFDSLEQLRLFCAGEEERLRRLDLFKSVSLAVTETNQPGTAAVVVTVEDKGPLSVQPIFKVSKANGFRLGAVLEAVNIGGSLMDFGALGFYTAPEYGGSATVKKENLYNDNGGAYLFDLRNPIRKAAEGPFGSFHWSSGSFSAGAYLNKIYAGPALLDFSYTFSKFAPELNDREVERFVWGSWQSEFDLQALFLLPDPWKAVSSSDYIFSHKNSIIIDLSETDYKLPLKHNFKQQLDFVYDEADRAGKMRIGLFGRTGLVWQVFVPEGRIADYSFGAEAEAAYFWNIGDWFFPSVRAAGALYSGRERYDLAHRFVRGVGEYALRGNGGLFFNSEARFKLFYIPKLGEAHLALYADYAAVFDIRRPQTVKNQGFGVGIDAIGILDIAPKTPIRVSAGYDLRASGYAFNDWSKRLYLDLGAGFFY